MSEKPTTTAPGTRGVSLSEAMAAATAQQHADNPPRRLVWLPTAIGVAVTSLVAIAIAMAIRPVALHGQLVADQQRLTSPISGQIQLAVTTGEAVNEGAILATIRNDHLDRSQFEALSARRQALVARQAANQAELDQVQSGGIEVDPLRQADRVARLQDIERAAEDTAQRLATLAKETVAEEQRLADLAERVITADKPVQIRRLLAAADGRIAVGTELMEVVDSASIEITAELSLGTELAIGDVVAITILPSGVMADGAVLSISDNATGRVVHVAVPTELRQANLIGARARLAILGKEPGRTDRLGEKLWRVLQP